MEIMNARELIGFKVKDGDYTLQAEKIIPYWKGKSTRDKIMEAMSRNGRTLLQLECSQSSWNKELRPYRCG